MGAASENSAGGRIDGIDGIDGIDSSAVVQERHDSVVDIYRREYSGIARLAFLLVGDRHQAEDLAHDAFVRLYEHWDDLDDRGNAVGYLRTTTAKLAMTVHRRNRARRKYAAATESLLGAANAVSAEAEALSRSARPVARDNDDVARHRGPRDDRAADDRSRGRATRDRTAGADTPAAPATTHAPPPPAPPTTRPPAPTAPPTTHTPTTTQPPVGFSANQTWGTCGSEPPYEELFGTATSGGRRSPYRRRTDRGRRVRTVPGTGTSRCSSRQRPLRAVHDQRELRPGVGVLPLYPHPLTRESVRLEQNLGDEW